MQMTGVGCGMSNSEVLAEVFKDVGCELRALVRDECVRETENANKLLFDGPYYTL